VGGHIDFVADVDVRLIAAILLAGVLLTAVVTTGTGVLTTVDDVLVGVCAAVVTARTGVLAAGVLGTGVVTSGIGLVARVFGLTTVGIFDIGFNATGH
jgi:hypothetical protein